MSAPNQKNRKYTPQEYLELERKAEQKSEYFKGEIFAMSGATRQHNVISGNFYAFLHQKLKSKGCRPYGSDMRVHVPINSLYTYPDISVVCGKEEFLDNEFDTLLNPIFICEILTTSTTKSKKRRRVKRPNPRKRRTMPKILLAEDDATMVMLLTDRTRAGTQRARARAPSPHAANRTPPDNTEHRTGNSERGSRNSRAPSGPI